MQRLPFLQHHPSSGRNEPDSNANVISIHLEKHSPSFTFSYTTSAESAGKGEVCVTASDLFMLNGIVWVTTATI